MSSAQREQLSKAVSHTTSWDAFLGDYVEIKVLKGKTKGTDEQISILS